MVVQHNGLWVRNGREVNGTHAMKELVHWQTGKNGRYQPNTQPTDTKTEHQPNSPRPFLCSSPPPPNLSEAVNLCRMLDMPTAAKMHAIGARVSMSRTMTPAKYHDRVP